MLLVPVLDPKLLEVFVLSLLLTLPLHIVSNASQCHEGAIVYNGFI